MFLQLSSSFSSAQRLMESGCSMQITDSSAIHPSGCLTRPVSIDSCCGAEFVALAVAIFGILVYPIGIPAFA